MNTVGTSLTSYGFDRICEFEQTEQATSELEVLAKRVKIEMGCVILSLIGAIEAIGRLAFAIALVPIDSFFAHYQIRHILQETVEGLIATINATAYSLLALYVNLFGNNSLTLQQEVRLTFHPIEVRSSRAIRQLFS